MLGNMNAGYDEGWMGKDYKLKIKYRTWKMDQ
jgi:hypothetical protein